VERTEEAAAKDDALAAATKLASRMRTALGDTTPEAVQLKQAETFSARSLEAAHAYALAGELAAEGKYGSARASYLEALKLDPGLGRAYTGLAALESNLGRHAEAERWLKTAMAHLDRMSEREKLRSRGVYYLVQRQTDKAIEAFTALVEQFPSDNAGLNNLAVAYQLRRDFPRAFAQARRAVAIYPRAVPQRNNVGLFATYAGDFDTAMAEQQQVIELGPSFQNGYVGLALAQLAAGRRDEALATWSRLNALPGGASAAAEGLADVAAYEGRLADARTLLAAGIAADRAAKDADAAARKLAMLAEVQLRSGETRPAVASAETALKAGDQEYVTFMAAMVLAEAGEGRRAAELADVLDRRIAAEPRMLAGVVRGTLERRRGRHPQAIGQLQAAIGHVNSWVARRALGRAYLDAGAFTEAQDELEACEKRRGEATDAFLDIVPTYRYRAPVLYDLARAQEALGSAAAPETFRAFLATQRSDEDPLARDARRRAGAAPAVAAGTERR
jgi:tetratricopeptide (TPR) repeat protein